MTTHYLPKLIFLTGLVALTLSGCEKSDDEGCNVDCAFGEPVKVGSEDCRCLSQNEVIEQDVTSNTTWKADTIHILDGKVFVRSGATLTIEAGTIIKGAKGTGALASALVVSQGAKIRAEGTAANPIIFTSIDDDIKVGQKNGTNLDEKNRGLWGGLVLLGNAPGSFKQGESTAAIEGIPANVGGNTYGGSASNDDSGVLQYVSIRHGGATLSEDNEINGLTLGGVGSGTIIENIEVVANDDDGIEFFGGTVNVTNALVWAQGDDGFDVDQAYSGTLSNFVYIAGQASDHGLELDGPEGSAKGSFTLENGTLKGFADNPSKGNEIADCRDGLAGTLTDCKILGFASGDGRGDLELDDDETVQNYLNGDLIITNITFIDSRSLADLCNVGGDVTIADAESQFDAKMAEAANGNTVVSPEDAGTASGGADISPFSWTYASEKKALEGL